MPERTTSAPPDTLHQYLARHHFARTPATAHGSTTTREATLLYCLTASAVCLYEAVFSPGTLAPVIIAAVRTTVRTPPIQTG
jgi:hypothetical protein